MYIAVCDDQTEELKDLTELLGAWETDRGTPVRVKSFRSAAELLDGMNELYDGLNEFNVEAVQKILDALNGDYAALKDRAEAMLDMTRDYASYGGIADGKTGSVQFLIRTAGI